MNRPSRKHSIPLCRPSHFANLKQKQTEIKRAAKVAGSTLIPDHDGLVELTVPRFSGAAHLRCVTGRLSWAPGALNAPRAWGSFR
jgi:hypothetical protein